MTLQCSTCKKEAREGSGRLRFWLCGSRCWRREQRELSRHHPLRRRPLKRKRNRLRHKNLPQPRAIPISKVWVNTHSGVYHCPNTHWYGATKSGVYMKQAEAQQKGYVPHTIGFADNRSPANP